MDENQLKNGEIKGKSAEGSRKRWQAVMGSVLVMILGMFFLVATVTDFSIRLASGQSLEGVAFFIAGLGILIIFIWVDARRRPNRKNWKLPLGIAFMVFGLLMCYSARSNTQMSQQLAQAAKGLLPAGISFLVLGGLFILSSISSDRHETHQEQFNKKDLAQLDEQDLAQLSETFSSSSTEDLKAIYAKRGTDEYRQEATEVVRRILVGRGELK